MTRVLITGWGLVAQAIARRCHDLGYETMALSRSVSSTPRTRRIDLATAPDPPREILRSYRPDYVMHTAAFTDVRGCEREVNRAFRENVAMTEYVIEAARDVGANTVGFSTDWVFAGGAEPYTELDVVSPMNVYGLTKAWSERVVLDAGGLVLRGSFLGRRPDGRQGLIELLLDTSRQHQALPNKRTNPLWVGDAAGIAIELITRGASGILHIGSRDSVGGAELATTIRGSNESVAEVEPADGVARPRQTVLQVGAVSHFLGRDMPLVSETVQGMLASPALAA